MLGLRLHQADAGHTLCRDAHLDRSVVLAKGGPLVAGVGVFRPSGGLDGATAVSRVMCRYSGNRADYDLSTEGSHPFSVGLGVTPSVGPPAL